jgi:hypothetical protein
MRILKFHIRVIVLGCLATLLTLSSCICQGDLCGSGAYRCEFIYHVQTSAIPVIHNSDNHAILLSDGNLLRYDYFFKNEHLINLAEICGRTDVRDIAFFNFNLNFRNFSQPDLVFPPESTFFIAALSPTTCFKLDTSFNFISSFSSDSGGNGTLINAVSMDIDLDGKTYISDLGDDAIKIFDRNGVFINSWRGPAMPIHLKIYNDKVYILDSTTSSIKAYDKAGNLLGTYLDQSGLSDVITFSFHDAGSVWIADMNGQRVTLFDLTGDKREEKVDYCFNDVTYSFLRISSLDGTYGFLLVADKDADRILDFTLGSHIM